MAGLARRLAGVGVLLATLACCGAWAAPASAVSPPSISKSFGVSSIPLNTSTSLSFTIINPNAATGLTSIGFTDSLPSGLVVATPNALSSDCNGTVTAAQGTSSVSMSGTMLAPHDGCVISVNVHGITNGKKENSVTVGSNSGTGNTSTATLQVGSLVPGDRVYWSNLGDSLAFTNLNGTGGGDLDIAGAPPGDEAIGVALNPAAGRIYWASFLNNEIFYANLDGSGGAHSLDTGAATVNFPTGVAVDPAANRIYWANQGPGSGKISYANLDGTGNGHDLNTTGANVTTPKGVAVDPPSGRIYWTNGGGNPVSSAKLDGSGGGHDYVTTGTTGGGNGLAVDSAAGLIYLPGSGGVGYVRLDDGGGGGLDFTGADLNSGVGVALDPAANKIYWANSGTLNPVGAGANTIARTNLDNSGGGQDLDTTGATVDRPFYLALLEVPAGAGAPAVTGGSTPGSVLSCSQGTWAPDELGFFLYRAPQSFAYQWRLNGADVPGATSTSYAAASPGTYSCRVTASNAAGSGQQTSAPFIIPGPPTGQRAAALKKCKKKHGRARKKCKRKANRLPV